MATRPDGDDELLAGVEQDSVVWLFSRARRRRSRLSS
jgi:hypothetical protein